MEQWDAFPPMWLMPARMARTGLTEEVPCSAGNAGSAQADWPFNLPESDRVAPAFSSLLFRNLIP